jgi:xylose isomerase
MENTNIKLLWGTANLFSHPRYMAGAATNPDPEVFKCAAAQVKCMLETTHQLGGENYVLWGGREGYDSLLNTDIKQELEQYARFLSLVIEHKTKIGFKGQILIEPKPHEPAKHQANHATMAGSSFEHEVANALALKAFGSIDINRGDPQNAWDTDQFNNDYKEMALVMKHILLDGGFKKGGFNFDAKLRRQSIDVEDLFIGHIGGIDVLARALIIAIKMIEDEFLENFKKERYKKWQQKEGQEILAGKLTLEDLAKGVTNPNPKSGNQELLEKYINDIC